MHQLNTAIRLQKINKLAARIAARYNGASPSPSDHDYGRWTRLRTLNTACKDSLSFMPWYKFRSLMSTAKKTLGVQSCTP